MKNCTSINYNFFRKSSTIHQPFIVHTPFHSTMPKQSSQNMEKDVAAPNRLLFLDDLDVGVTGTIVVMVCRSWDVNAVTGRYLSTDFVVSDSKVQPLLVSCCLFVLHDLI